MTRFRLACAACAATLILPLTPALADDGEADHEHAHDHGHDAHPDAERIVVTATPLEHERDELAIPIVRLSRDEVIRRAGSTLGETLSQVPGVSTTGFTSGASRPVIRGQDAFRTEVLEDSLTTQDVSRLSPDHAVPTNPLTAQSVEIVRGPATLRYGGGASAGVVNTITARIPQRRSDAPASADVIGSYGTNEDEGVAAVVLKGQAGDFGWHADGLFQRADDYETGEGNRQRGTHREGGSAAIGGAWFGDDARIGASYSYFTNDYGIPEEDEDVVVEMDTHRYRFEGDVGLGDGLLRELRVLGVYSDYEHQEIAGGEVGQTFDNDEFEGRAELLHRPLAGFEGALGFTARYRDFEAGGEAAEFLAPTETQQYAVYFYEERPVLDAFEAQLGLRIEYSEVEGTPLGGTRQTVDFVPVSGSIGVVWHLDALGDFFSGWTVGLTGSASQRAPSDVELFARGPHEATGTYERGNVSLDEETSFSGDLRIGGMIGPVSIELANFITRYDDYVFGRLTGATLDEDGNPAVGPDVLDELIYTARDAQFYGGEIALESDLFELGDGAVVLDAQFDWVRARFVDSVAGASQNVPRIPPIRWGAGIGYRGERFDGRVGFFRSENQTYTGDFENGVDDYTMVDLRLAYRLAVPRDAGELELFLDGRNLADEAARNPVAINKDDVLLRGRTFRIGLRGTF